MGKVCCYVETNEQLVIQQLQVMLAVHHLTLLENLSSPMTLRPEV
jgi:hypothetical protein